MRSLNFDIQFPASEAVDYAFNCEKKKKARKSKRILPLDDADAHLPKRVREGQTEERPHGSVGWRLTPPSDGPLLGRRLGGGTGGPGARLRWRRLLMHVRQLRRIHCTTDVRLLAGDGGGRDVGGRGNRLGPRQPSRWAQRRAPIPPRAHRSLVSSSVLPVLRRRSHVLLLLLRRRSRDWCLATQMAAIDADRRGVSEAHHHALQLAGMLRHWAATKLPP